jgi:hypothetical protein
MKSRAKRVSSRRSTPVLKIAEQFFVQPPAVLNGHEGLEGLLDEAYWRTAWWKRSTISISSTFNQPLIPLDMTVANVIAHHLIGETFANQLDEAVHHAVDCMLDDECFALESVEAYRDKLTSPDTGAAWKRWPCLSKQLGVGLAL